MYRSSKNARVGGLCAAVADTFGMKVTYIRLGYAAFTIATSFVPGIFLYFLMCLLIPKRDDLETQNNTVAVKVKNNSINTAKSFSSQNTVRATVEQITKLSNAILNRQKTNPLVSRIVEEFKGKIVEFQKYSPALEKQYLDCLQYLKDNGIEKIKQNIEELKVKIQLSSENAKANYKSILEQNEKRLQLLDEIKDFTEVIESKLYLILNTLQNIEASILHAELQTQVEDNKYDNLQSQISILTENMSEMSDIFKRNKIRL